MMQLPVVARQVLSASFGPPRLNSSSVLHSCTQQELLDKVRRVSTINPHLLISCSCVSGIKYGTISTAAKNKKHTIHSMRLFWTVGKSREEHNQQSGLNSIMSQCSSVIVWRLDMNKVNHCVLWRLETVETWHPVILTDVCSCTG